MRVLRTIVLVACMLPLAACGNRVGDRAASGALIGAGAGALGGALIWQPVAGAIIGAGVGAAAGALSNSDEIDFGKPAWE